MVVEMLGATATMLYGLNIVMDPVHEELEMEPDAPGITKVTRLTPSCVLLEGACSRTLGMHIMGSPSASRHAHITGL